MDKWEWFLFGIVCGALPAYQWGYGHALEWAEKLYSGRAK
jgi:hypothetical protein